MNPARCALAENVRRREIWAWAMYDFANSGYTTVVITAVFNAYFVAVVAAGAPWATLAWTLTLSASYLAILLSAPLVGAYADERACKKRLLAWTTAGCIAATAGLYWAGPGALVWAVVCVVVSNFCFATGQNLIAAFLPELARSHAMGRVSGWGWSLGYVGGLLALGLSLAWITRAQAAGETAAQFVPATMLITAGLFALAVVPTFLFLRERALPRPDAALGPWQRLAHSAREAGRFRDLARFMLCGMFYQAGIQAVIALAAIYAQEAMRFTTTQTLTLILVVNVTASIGAFAFGYLQDAIGHVRAIALTLAGWLAMVVIAWSAEGLAAFWLAANIAGLCMGASQSAGRALVGLLAPAARAAEFYGLWGVATNVSAVLGPLTYGVANWLAGGDHRVAMLATGTYFVIGLALLCGVNVRRGRFAALRAGRRDAATSSGAARPA